MQKDFESSYINIRDQYNFFSINFSFCIVLCMHYRSVHCQTVDCGINKGLCEKQIVKVQQPDITVSQLRILPRNPNMI